MAWPQASEFQDAVQDPGSFADPELRAAELATNHQGLPRVASGQYGVVYQFRATDGRRWAVKCFTKQVASRAERYRKLSQHLAQARLNFLIDFEYLDPGIQVKGQWYPILKMQWVEGQRLNGFVADRLGQPVVEKLIGMWLKVSQMLREAKVTHADLQHGNVLLVPAAEGRVSLKLVDYDGMYLPSLAGIASGEVGHPAYQHPERLSTGHYGPEVDRFSHLVIYTALQALLARGRSLWDTHNQGDNLLFAQSDFAAPDRSKLLRDLWENGPDSVRQLAGHLILATRRPLADVVLLDQAIGSALDATQRSGVERILGIRAKPATVPPPPKPEPAEDSLFLLPEPADPPQKSDASAMSNAAQEILRRYMRRPRETSESTPAPTVEPAKTTPQPGGRTEQTAAVRQPAEPASVPPRLPVYQRLRGKAVLQDPLFQENAGTFAVAYGLALQGIKQSRMVVNLLPSEEGGFFSRLRKRLTGTKPSDKCAWGIDIGQCALKALRLELIDDELIATAFDYIEHPKILSQPDADPDELIREAVEKFRSRNSIEGDTIAVGIAGQSGLARFVKLPPVEEKKIAEIVKFEAKQQIPFPLDEVVWDFQKIGGTVLDGFVLETEIGLFAMKRDVVSRYLGYFTRSEIDVHVVQMAPMALINFATYELLKKDESKGDDTPRGKKRCTVVLDIGTDGSSLVVTDGAKIIWQRPIPLGGNNFTRALTKELKLTFAKAEHLKRNAAQSTELRNILKAMKPVLTEFVGEVQRSLGYFTNTHRDAHVARVVGVGNGFKLPGLSKFLEEKLSLEVRRAT